jgi:hypothetical protein
VHKVSLSETALHKLFMKCRKYLPRRVKLMIADIHFKIYGRKMPWSLLRFEVHLTDKCNLNCAGCLHFSSLCKELNLLDIKDFLILTRKYFSEMNVSNQTGMIELVTNGILLHEQSDDFWTVCKKNNIRIVISYYHVKIKEEIIREKAMKFNVELKMYKEKIQSKVTGSANQWAKIPIDTNGSQYNRKSFEKCFLAGNCFQLVNGKIFKCARIAYINHFNAAFGKQLKADENDHVDIYKIEDIDEILFLLTKPASFCRYCFAGEISWNNKWEVSKKTIDEYM